MKKCFKCGTENIDEAVFCIDCGERLDLARSNPSTNDSNKESSKPGNQKPVQKKNPFKIACCYLPIALFAFVIILGVAIASFPESFHSSYTDDFNYLDSNGDGLLSFQEARQYDPYMDKDLMKSYFTQADRSNNGFLKGIEFDYFRSDVRNSDSYSFKSTESTSSSSGSSSKGSSNYKSSKSKTSSSSNSQEYDSQDGYVLTCPYCGSESIYEVGSYYRCAECGSNIYDPDDLELGYVDGYMELLAPVCLST